METNADAFWSCRSPYSCPAVREPFFGEDGIDTLRRRRGTKARQR